MILLVQQSNPAQGIEVEQLIQPGRGDIDGGNRTNDPILEVQPRPKEEEDPKRRQNTRYPLRPQERIYKKEKERIDVTS